MALLRAPILLLRWLVVLVAVVAWLAIVPLVDLLKGLARRVRRLPLL